MKHAFIAPVSVLGMVPAESDFHLMLAPLMKNSEYVEYYKRKALRGDTIIVDNGAFEAKAPLNVDDYYKLVFDSGINPTVVVAPDYPFEDWRKTVDSALRFCDDAKRVFGSDIKIMAVPQSMPGDVAGWLQAYTHFLKHDGIHMIGMSILGIPNAWKSVTGTEDISYNRTYATIRLKEMHGDRLKEKWHHYLGCGDPREILTMKVLGVADSNDSSTAIWHGINGIKFDNTASSLVGGKIKKEVDFIGYFEPDAHQLECIKHNISVIESWVSDKETFLEEI